MASSLLLLRRAVGTPALGRASAPAAIFAGSGRLDGIADRSSVLSSKRRYSPSSPWARAPKDEATSRAGPAAAAAAASAPAAAERAGSSSVKGNSLSTDARLDLEAPPPPAAASSLTPSEMTTAASELSKAKLSALVVATSTAGFLAAGGPISYPTLAACSLGTALCSSSASTWNQIFEVDRDRKMKRTANRPLVRGTVSVRSAAALATATGVGGGAVLAVGTDPVTATLGVANIALYAGLYTHMKPRSELNTWAGAVVGAIPPVMGWTAATGGSLMDAEALMLGSTLFLWQFPHFFALSWMHRVDYGRGGFRMVPVNDPTGDRTSDLITRYTWYLSTVPLASSALGVTSSMFAVEGIALNAYALHVARRFHRERTNANARKVFLTSLWYLPCLMTLFILHSRRWRDTEEAKTEVEGDLLDLLKARANKLRSLGRELCIHEFVVAKEEDGSEGNCPVALGKSKAKEAKEKGTQVAVAVTGNLEAEK